MPGRNCRIIPQKSFSMAPKVGAVMRRQAVVLEGEDVDLAPSYRQKPLARRMPAR